jgi:hydrogenase expression/formation protein HypD
MMLKYIEEYRDSELCQRLTARIQRFGVGDIRLMEVCGTHTVSIFRNGIRTILPESISLLSGPGCPVCVTAQRDIDAFIETAKRKDVIVATFGDLMRVPGTYSSLQRERANGADVRVVYSAFDALALAQKHPDKKIVFLGVGFETTAPTVAAALLLARKQGIRNFLVFSAMKLVVPALEALVSTPTLKIDGFMLPGHVSVVIGTEAYRDFFEHHRIPCVVAGFEPVDILHAISLLVEQAAHKRPGLENAYERAVKPEGNLKARSTMGEVLETNEVPWRGLGSIPESGLTLRETFKSFDAAETLELDISYSKDPKGCGCGDILRGLKKPTECALFSSTCNPANPIGPCMVSSEGTCAAYFRYQRT